MSAAIFYTGCLPAKALRMFKTLNCASIARKTYFQHQNTYLQLAIRLVWERQQRKLLSELMIEKKGLVLAGDGSTVPSMAHIQSLTSTKTRW